MPHADDTDLKQTQSLLTLYQMQLTQLPAGDPMIPILKDNITKLQAMISPPPPPPPEAGQSLIPPSYRKTKRNVRDLDPALVAEAMQSYNEDLKEEDKLTLQEFIKLRGEQLTLYFRAYYYCGQWYAAPPKDHVAWDDFVSFAGQTVADHKDLYKAYKVE